MFVIVRACQARYVRVHALDLPGQCVGVCGVVIRLSATHTIR